MATLQQTAIITKLHTEEMSLFTVSDFRKLFAVAKDNTAYKIIARLVGIREYLQIVFLNCLYWGKQSEQYVNNGIS